MSDSISVSHAPVEVIQRELRNFRRESLLLGAIGKHPHIIELIAVCLSPPSLILSLEDGGDLSGLLKDKDKTISVRSGMY